MLRCTDEAVVEGRHNEPILKGDENQWHAQEGELQLRSICLRVNSPTRSEVDGLAGAGRVRRRKAMRDDVAEPELSQLDSSGMGSKGRSMPELAHQLILGPTSYRSGWEVEGQAPRAPRQARRAISAVGTGGRGT